MLESLKCAVLVAGIFAQGQLLANDFESWEGNVVEFHIPEGTGAGHWNEKDSMVLVHVGETLRIVNDDSITHAVHMTGAPCRHTPDIHPGESHECVVQKPYDPDVYGPLFDHYIGPRATFWLKATND